MDDNKNIKNVLDQIFSKGSKLSKTYNAHSIEEIWRETFGDVISSYTSRVMYNNEILTLYITSSPLKEEIMMNKQSIMDKLNKKLQYRKITEIRIR